MGIPQARGATSTGFREPGVVLNINCFELNGIMHSNVLRGVLCSLVLPRRRSLHKLGAVQAVAPRRRPSYAPWTPRTAHGLSTEVDFPRTAHKLSRDTPRTVHGLPADCPRTVHQLCLRSVRGLSAEYPRTILVRPTDCPQAPHGLIRGLSAECRRTIHVRSMDCPQTPHGLSTDCL